MGNLLEPFVWLALGIAATFLSTRYNMGDLRDPGPGVLPFGLGLVLILLSTILILNRWRGKQAEKRHSFGLRWRQVVLVIMFLAADALLLEYLGYLLAIFLLVAVVMLIMEPKRWISALLLGCFSSFFTYLLFETWLKVSLPTGLLYF